MKKTLVWLVMGVFQSICFSQSNESTSSQLAVGVIGVLGNVSNPGFELEQEELAFTFEFSDLLTKRFSLGLEVNYIVFTDENGDTNDNEDSDDNEDTDDNGAEEPQGELQSQAGLTAVPVMLTLKRYFWSSRFQPYLKLSGGALLGWIEGEDEDEAPTDPNQSEATKFKFGGAGGVFAGLDWRFLGKLGLNLQGGILYRNIAGRGTSTVMAQAGLLYRF